MSAKTWSRVPTVLLTVVLIVSLGVGVWLDQNGPQWPRAIEMMKILPADIVRISYTDFSGTYSSFRDQKFEGYSDKDFYGQELDDIKGFAECRSSDNVDDPSNTLTLYEGEFDAVSMARAMKEEAGGFGPASRYGGILVWTWTHGDASASIALIDRYMVAGTTQRVQQCVEVAQGKRGSFYDRADARDVVRRLPKDCGFLVLVGPPASENEAGRLAVAATFLPVLTYTSTTVEKYGDANSATARVARLEAERAHQSNPTGFEISRDGVFVMYTRVVNQ